MLGARRRPNPPTLQPMHTPGGGLPPGSSSDRVARIVADKLQAKLGSQSSSGNKAGRVVASARYVKATPANQPALLLANPAVMVVALLVASPTRATTQSDFRAVSHVNSYEFGVTVGSAVPVKELPHLLAWLPPTRKSQLRRASHRQPSALLLA